jgi:large subunit ribosomal protein L7/L12
MNRKAFTNMSTRKTPEQQLNELLQKEARLKAQIQKKAAQVRGVDRKKDTRRKIIAGALALEHMAHDKEFANVMKKLLNEHVTRTADRELFDL